MDSAKNETSDHFAHLLSGYHRFRENGYHRERNRWAELQEGQEPKVMVIACSDSRVEPAQIFDMSPGEVFVVRNVAALVPPFETTPGLHGVSAALEFAVQVLNVREILVMGHGMCGGCQASLTQALHGTEPGRGGFIAQWIAQLDHVRGPIVEQYGTEGREAERAMERAAVKVSLENLRTFPCVQSKEKSQKLTLRGAYFSISEGILYLLDEMSGEFNPVK